jgi:hypothetical protein
MTGGTSVRSHAGIGSDEYGPEPRVLVLAEEGEERERLVAEALAAGCRITEIVPVRGGAKRIDRQAAAEAILVAGNPQMPDFVPVLGRLDSAARAGFFRSVVFAPIEAVDVVAALAEHGDVQHVCEASADERIAAIVHAVRPRRAMLHDVNKGQTTVRLQQLSEEVGRIASILASLSEDEALQDAGEGAEGEDSRPRIEAGQIRAMIRARRLRDHFFRTELFADPAWDMMLDLMAARIEKQRVAVSSLCIAAAVPPTTALRWIKSLCDQGLFVRVADPEDGRRVFIELADKTAASLEAYLRAAQRISPLLV